MMLPQKDAKTRPRARCLIARALRYALLGLLFFATSVLARPILNDVSVGWSQPGETWLTLESSHFLVHYRSPSEHWARRVIGIAESVYPQSMARLGWQPAARVHVVLVDNFDLANGWANVVPFNQMRIYLSAPDDFHSLENQTDWLTLLVTHELAHVLHLDQSRKLPAGLQSVFGRSLWFFPHLFEPLFLIEGLAVREESADGVSGRLHSTHYAMQMRAQAATGFRSLGHVSTTNRRWPPGEPYLYGAFFYQFLDETQGADRVTEFLQSYSGNLLPFWLNPTAKRVFGQSFDNLWASYQSWLSDRFLSEQGADAYEQTGDVVPVTEHGLRSYPPVPGVDGVWRVRNDGHGPLRLVCYGADGEVRKVIPAPDAGLFDVRDDGAIVMARMRTRRENHVFSDLYLHTGKRWKRLTYQGRYREARWLSDGRLLARRQVNGVSSLVRLSASGVEQSILWQGAPGDVLGRFVVLPDEQHVVMALQPAQGRWQLAHLSLSSGELAWLTADDHLYGQVSLSADGQAILYVADPDGRYQVYRRDLASGEVVRLTHQHTGAFNPVESADGSLWFEGYSARGYDLQRLPAAAVVLHDDGVLPKRIEPVFATPIDEAITQPPRAYSAWSSLRPHWWEPVLYMDEMTTVAGLLTGGQDALGQHSYSLMAAGDSASDSYLGYLGYQYSNRLLLTLTRDLSHDHVQETLARVRAENTFTLAWLNMASVLDDDLVVHGAVTHEKQWDLWRQEGVARTPSLVRGLAGLAFVFDDSHSYWHSISPASGRRIALVAETNDLLNSDYSGETYSLDWHEYLHLGRSHVLALRLAGAIADEQASLLTLGGERRELSGALFGRSSYSLRGYRRNALPGWQVGLASAEWRMPLARIQRGWGIYPLGLHDIHGALFADVGSVWKSPDPALDGRAFAGAGLELTVEFVAGYQMVLPVSIGVAEGFDEQLGESRAYVAVGSVF